MFFQNNEERKNEKTNVQMTVTADDIWVLSILASQEHKSKVANKNIHSAWKHYQTELVALCSHKTSCKEPIIPVSFVRAL